MKLEYNLNGDDIKEQLSAMISEIRECCDILTEKQKQELNEYIDVIEENVAQKKVKKNMIKTAFEGLKKLSEDSKYVETIAKWAPFILKIIEGRNF